MSIRLPATLAALVLVALAVNLGVEYLPHAPQAQAVRTALSAGLLILGAWLAGMLCERIALPHITGYLMFGILVGPSVAGLIPAAQVYGVAGGEPPLRFASDLAIALIAITAGGEIKLDWLRGRIGRLLLLVGIDVAIIIAMGTAAIFLARPVIPFLDDAGARTAAYVALLGATVMIANSPTVVIAMISDYRAAGPLTQMTLSFTVCKDLVLIVLFATVTTLIRGALDPATTVSGAFLLAVGAQLIGSVLLGAAIGVAMAWYVHRVNAHLVLFVVGSCMLFALVGEQPFEVAGQSVHLEPLLLALSAGMLMRNLWPRQTEPLFRTIETMSLPVYCLFFALAGTKVHLDAFAALWHVTLGLVLMRVAAIWIASAVGLRLAGIREQWTGLFWLGKIPQAGVTLVLISLIGRSFSDFPWGEPLSGLLIGMLVVHELLGPIGFRYALIRSGEAGQAERTRR